MFFTYFIYIGLIVFIPTLLGYRNSVLDKRVLYNDIYKSNLSIVTYFALVLLSVIIGYRYNVGVDWENYKDAYEDFEFYGAKYFVDNSMEFGFLLLNYLLVLLGANSSIMFLIVALLSWLIIFKSCSKYFLPLIVYFLFADEFFFWSMNGIRQFLAISIFLYSIKYIVKGDFIRYFIFIIIACFFHVSILFLMPFYFIRRINLQNTKIWLALYFLTFFLSKYSVLINGVEFLIIYLSNQFTFLPNYSHYVDSSMFAGEDISIGLGYYFRCLVSVYMILVSERIVKAIPQLQVYFLLFFIGIILENIFLNSLVINRFVIYLVVIRPVLLGFIVYYFLRSPYYYIGLIIIALYFILYIFAINNSSNMCAPFQFNF